MSEIWHLYIGNSASRHFGSSRRISPWDCTMYNGGGGGVKMSLKSGVGL